MTHALNPSFTLPLAVAATLKPARGLVVWLTGLSGAGKTTLAERLELELRAAGHGVYRLDGDILRKGLCSDLGFSLADRRENIRRAGEVACLLADAGLIAVAALISPFREDRQLIRNRLAPGGFVEVYVNAPLEVCERRDVKGLYRRARAGALPEFTGISSPYEPPVDAELEVRTDLLGIEDCVAQLKAAVLQRTGRAVPALA